jgi:starch phosphorylase
LREYQHERDFLDAFRSAKRANKQRLADYVGARLGIDIDPGALFDVQVKRMHEYKRQLLNLLHVIARYQAILAKPDADWVPRVVIFSGKAASAYVMAKQVIRLINDVAAVVNADARLRGRLKVVFIPNYSVSLAELIIPAADLSEQISTAGTEASGTGNMKLALNGAITIGTLDGANVEIREQVGDDNIFIFGHTTAEVADIRAQGYQPRNCYAANPQLAAALNAVRDGLFSPGERGRYQAVFDALMNWGDHYLLLADFASYVEAQQRADALYRQPEAWTRSALLNVAGMGLFSSDRTIDAYAREIWKTTPIRLDAASVFE